MATVFRKTYTKRLPEGAELFTRKGQRFARWKDAKGKTRTEKVTVPEKGRHAGKPRIVMEAGTYTAKYRDGSGVVQEATTGCRDEQAARGVLHQFLARAESVRGGYVTAEQDRIADHQKTAMPEHVAAYIDHLRAKGVTSARIDQTEGRLHRVFDDCGFARLPDLSADGLEGWLAARETEGMSAAARNGYRSACVAFGNWCAGKRGKVIVENQKRLPNNPFDGVHKANERTDPRRQRRALTEAELVKLLDVARRRPLLDAMTIRRGKDKGKPLADVRPEVRARLETLGRERALIYKTLVLTGLRKGELASLTVGDLELDANRPHAVLQAAAEKNRQGSRIALRADLVADLRRWIADRLEALRDACKASGDPLPAYLPAETPLFTVPAGLVRILDRDLVAAGIARKVKDEDTGKVRIDKRDDRGRTVDVHALRTSFGTLLSKGGVAPRTAQAAMRHGSIDLTMRTYTDPRLLDVAGALDALPGLPLDGGEKTEGQQATGTCDDRPLAPVLAPNLVQASISQANADKRATDTDRPTLKSERLEVPGNKGFRQPSAEADKRGRTGRCRTRTCDLILVRDAL